MKSANRTYRMRARAEAVEATRERIARVAMERFLAESYDAVTIASVAAAAGVSHQTVLNHFESKEGLFMAAAERFGADVRGNRALRAPDDAASAVAFLVDQYERTGDGNVRLAMLDDRIDAVAAVLDEARADHQAWLADIFAGRLPRAAPERKRALAALHAATDVYAWKLLRRDLGLGRRAPQPVMTEMVEAIVAAWPPDGEEHGR
jgi:AcrR family transcriptional regulator